MCATVCLLEGRDNTGGCALLLACKREDYGLYLRLPFAYAAAANKEETQQKQTHSTQELVCVCALFRKTPDTVSRVLIFSAKL